METAIRSFFTEGNPLNKLGALSVIVGVAVVFKYAVDHDYIGPKTRVGIGLGFGLALLWVGEHYARTGWKRFAAGVSAAGNGVLFLAVYFGQQQYGILPVGVAFGLYVLFTTGVTVQALRFDSQGLATWGMIGGYLTPALASTGSGNYVFVSCYLLVLGVGVFVLAYRRRWQILKWQAFLFTSGYTTLWVLAYLEDPRGTRWLELHWLLPSLVLFFLFFLAVPTWRSLLVRERIDVFGKILAVASGVVYFVLVAPVLYDDHRRWLGLAAGVVALFYGAIGFLMAREREEDEAGFRIFVGASAGFFVLATPFVVEGPTITLVWCAETVLIAWASTRPQLAFLRYHALAMLAVIAVRLGGYDDLLVRPRVATGIYLPFTELRSYPPFAGALTFLITGALLRRVPGLRFPLWPTFAAGGIVAVAAIDGEAYRVVRAMILPYAVPPFQDALRAGLVVTLVALPLLALRSRVLGSTPGWIGALGGGVLLLLFGARVLFDGATHQSLLQCLGVDGGLVWLHGTAVLLVPLALLFARLSTSRPRGAPEVESRRLQVVTLAVALGVAMLALSREAFALTHAPPFASLFPEAAGLASYRMVLTLGYTLLAFGVYLRGLRRDDPIVLRTAYALYVFTALKVYIFDLEARNQLFRAASLLVFGLILFLSSWFAKRLARSREST